MTAPNIDPAVRALSNARDRSAVHKMRLIQFKEGNQEALIFVFEGPDDAAAYYQWCQRIDMSIEYEPYVCKNKSQVLNLYLSAVSDTSDLKKNVYFFVDRDFDDLEKLNCATAPDNVFMTDMYAIENYIVNAMTMRNILKVDFHCGTKVDEQENILSCFQRAYDEYLENTKDINKRLYIATKTNLEIQKKPEKIGDLGAVCVRSFTIKCHDPTAMVVWNKEPEHDERLKWELEFETLDAQTRYRGKWAYMFFAAWLKALAADRRREDSEFFPTADRSVTVNESAITLQICASKSLIPLGLDVFLRRVS